LKEIKDKNKGSVCQKSVMKLVNRAIGLKEKKLNKTMLNV